MTLTQASPALDLTVTPLSGTIGAEIRGLDLKEPLEYPAVAALRKLLLQYKVIFFPGQHLEPAEHLAFAEHFGAPTPAHPVIPGIEGFPEVFEIDYTQAKELYRSLDDSASPRYDDASSWHTDVTFVERPPLGSILNAVVIPPSGGDTLFADQQAAYDSLSEPVRELIDGLTAIHSGARQFGDLLRRREDGGEWEGERYTRLDPVEHPVVRTHPETGRKALFVNPGFTQRIKGFSPRESTALLGLLYEHSHAPEHTVRYHWKTGDLGFWDNRVTQHSVVQDFGDQHRVIQRVTLRGDRPY
jgi:alpha-ketoglutarate-dependent taurine dioxygenase